VTTDRGRLLRVCAAPERRFSLSPGLATWQNTPARSLSVSESREVLS
jgi:hypothetical protein